MKWMGVMTMKSSGDCRRVSEDFASDRNGCSSPEHGSSTKLTNRSKSVELELAPLWGDRATGNNNAASSGQNGRSLRVNNFGKTSLKAASANYKDKYRKIQIASYNFLERPTGWKSVSYHAFLLLLIIASLIVSVISTVKNQPLIDHRVVSLLMFALEVIILVIFIMEYIIRMWAAGCRSCYVGWKGRLKFALKPFSILDLVVIVASLVVVVLAWPDMVGHHAISDPGNLRYIQEQPYIYLVLRFLQLVRMLRIDKQGGSWKLLGSVIYIHRQELLTTFYLGFCILVFASFILFLAERNQPGTHYNSFASSLWWGIVTLTTVGYGDTHPKSWYGKLCASCFMLMGISLFALPAGILGSGFALKVTQQQRQKHFHRRRRPAAILLQSYWRMYCAECDSSLIPSWLPHIYYNRAQILKADRSTSGTAVESPFHSYTSPQVQAKRRMSRFNNWRVETKIASRTASGESRMSRADSVAGPAMPSSSRKDSIQTLSLDSDFFGEAAIMESDEKDGVPLIALTNAQKHAIRLIRLLKLKVAARKFKEARKPYDVKDVMEQYSTGHVEMLSRLKYLQSKLDKALGARSDMGILQIDDDRSHILGRLTKVESQVSLLDQKLDVVLDILRRSQMFSRPATHVQSLDFIRGDRGSTQSVHRTYSDPHSYSRSEERTSMSQDSGDEIRVPYVTLTSPDTSATYGRGFSRSNSLPHSNSVEQESLCSPHSQSYSGQGGGPIASSNYTDDHFTKPDRVKLVAIAPLSVAQVERSRDIQFRQLSDVTEGDESQADSKENILASTAHEKTEATTENVSLSEKSNSESSDWVASATPKQQLPSAGTLSSDLKPFEGSSLEVPEGAKKVPVITSAREQPEVASGSDSVTSLQSSGDFSSNSADNRRRPFSLKRKPLTRHSNVDSADPINV